MANSIRNDASSIMKPSAAALGFMMLLVSFLTLFAINLVQGWSRRRYVRADH